MIQPRNVTGAGLLLLAVAGIYWPGLPGILLFDDFPNLGRYLSSGAPGSLSELSARDLLLESGPTGRPFAALSFAVNSLLNGQDLTIWKATNVAIHMLNALVAYLLTRRLSRSLGHDSPLLALAVAALWALHPLHVSTVLYTVQRMTGLATLFTLGGLCVYLAGREHLMSRRRGAHALLLSVPLLFLPLATLSKENGALLLPMIVLLEFMLLAQATPGSAVVRWSRRIAWGGLTLIVTTLAALLVWQPARILGGYATRPFTLTERLLTESRVMVEYIELTLLPRLTEMGLFHDAFPISTGLLNPPTTTVALLLLAVLAAAVWGLRRRAPLVAFGIGLFLVGHLMESTVIALDLMYEHRQYLPSLGLLLATVDGARRLPIRRELLAVTAILAVVVLAGLTWQRASAWGSEGTMYAQMLRAQPESPRLNIIVANRLAELGDAEGARHLLSRIDAPGVALNLAYLDCSESGRVATETQDAISFPDHPPLTFYETSGLINLARAGLLHGCELDANAYVRLADRALSRVIHGQRYDVALYRAYHLHKAGRIDEAVSATDALQLSRPDSGIPAALAGQWLIDAGELDRAARKLARARELGAPEALLAHALDRLERARLMPGGIEPFDLRDLPD